MKELIAHIIQDTVNIRVAIKKMDEAGIGFLCVVNGQDKVVGVITDGDFRRAVLKGIQLDQSVKLIMNPEFKYLEEGYTDDEAKFYFQNHVVEYLPVLANGKLVEIIVKDDLYDRHDMSEPKTVLDLPVVIMAGGKGTRLDPFTRIMPKALIPIGEKAIIEVIMDEYARYGISDFYVSVNHRGKMIKIFLDDLQNGYQVKYIDEDKPLGTAGALKQLSGKVTKPFFISNCDVIVKNDYAAIAKFHQEGKYDLTLVVSMRHLTIPYGVCTVEEEGLLKNIEEKPVFDFLVNTGMYVMSPKTLAFIPDGQAFNMDELIKVLQKNNNRVGVYPISEKSWADVGQWEEYNSTVKRLTH